MTSRAQGAAPVLPDSTRIGAPQPAPVENTVTVEDTTTGRVSRIPVDPDSAAAITERALIEAREARRRRAAANRALGLDAPRWVMLRSLVVPGWGQLHNRSYVKAAGVAAAEVSLIVKLVEDERELDRLSRRVDEAQAANDEEAFSRAVDAYNDRLSSSVGRRWLLGGLLAFALVDAYVDAHFRDFNVEFDTDPNTGAPNARLRWRRSF